MVDDLRSRGSGDRTVIIAGGVSDATAQATTQTMSRFLNKLPKITIREGSRNSKLFNEIETKVIDTKLPGWISWNSKEKELSVKSGTLAEASELMFDLGQVIEYYQR